MMKFVGILLVVISLLAIGLLVMARRGPNLAEEYQKQLAREASRQRSEQPVITEASVAELPEPVQRYIRYTGSVGKPRISSVHVFFDTEMFQKPGDAGMKGPSEQYDRFDGPKRLFFMQTKMYGLPVQVLHDFDRSTASMRVRIASLFDAVHIQSEELALGETVTILNDLCLFAPSWLTDPRLTWEPVDRDSARVVFVNGAHRVSAMLFFNAQGEITNFVSDDRAALQPDGSLKKLRWSTPVENYRDFGGRRYPTFGQTVYRYPEGDFTYGKFVVRDVRAD